MNLELHASELRKAQVIERDLLRRAITPDQALRRLSDVADFTGFQLEFDLPDDKDKDHHRAIRRRYEELMRTVQRQQWAVRCLAKRSACPRRARVHVHHWRARRAGACVGAERLGGPEGSVAG